MNNKFHQKNSRLFLPRVAPSLLPLNRTKIITESAVKNDEQERQSFLAHSLFFSLFSNHDIWTFSFFFFFLQEERTHETAQIINYQRGEKKQQLTRNGFISLSWDAIYVENIHVSPNHQPR